MADKLTRLFVQHSDVIYTVEQWEESAWGVRAEFYDDRVGIVRMMVYGPATTKAQLERALTFIDP